MRRVVKVGGSLLKRPGLAKLISRWIKAQPNAENIFLFGGGETIDAMRRLDEIHSLDIVKVHWICVDLLDASFCIAEQLLRNGHERWNLIKTSDQFEQLRLQTPDAAEHAGNYLLQCGSFYRPDHCGSLPQDWRTTTDSIAAFLADQTNADELVLLKSCAIAPDLSIEQLAQQGIVDKAFPDASKHRSSIRIERIAGS
jgi:aspartokinase-like uncharacterized kinase